MNGTVSIMPVAGLGEITPDTDLPSLIRKCYPGTPEPGDILIVTHKACSKWEGRIIELANVEPSPMAVNFAKKYGKDPRHIEVILRESAEIIRMQRGIIISRTHHGFICANAGVDMSNAGLPQTACLLPCDPDRSARIIHERLSNMCGFALPVIISDSFGRAWREGIANVAIGVAGMSPFADYRGEKDPQGRELKVTRMAIADEIASAAELVMGKLSRIPAAIMRGCQWTPSDDGATALIRPQEKDLFL